MKGYAEVSCKKAMMARYNYINYIEQTEILVFNELIPRYYTQEYPKQNFVLKWFYKNKNPKQFLAKKIPAFGCYSDELYKVATVQELEALGKWEWCGETNRQSRAIRNLCIASTKGTIYVDNELAAFIKEWY